jgi:hypothetical protein
MIDAAMPPSGGIVVSAPGFSTTCVDGCRTKLWTSRFHGFADKHLARIDENLRSALQVFHSDCGGGWVKPVDRWSICLIAQRTATC